ncbi:MAG TPA: UvrD-helicase domain-containing protein, partial [Bacteroidota bacterium]|nr:UvrD-helicase domain-containing protein [Bacteroidota bacterium]
MNQFSLERDPIEGMNVLEASAGTGKTFTIAGLYLRMVLEKKLDVNQILVVTFTEAATAELHERVRETLKTALNAFTRKIEGIEETQFHPSPIPHMLETMDAGEAVKRLTVNLQTFDEAAIRTIHGFCRMLLLENSFECGAQFDCELEANQDALIELVTSDYWRRMIGHATPLLARALNTWSSQLNVKSLSRLIKQAMDHLDIEIIPPAPGLPDESVCDAYAMIIHKVQSLWADERDAIVQLLAGNRDLKQTTYAPERVRARAEVLTRFLIMPTSSALLPGDCLIFTQTRINASVKKHRSAPEHEFFMLMDKAVVASLAVEQAYATAVLTIKRNAFEYVATHLERRKREMNILAYNDLLLKTRDALRSPAAQLLITKMRNRYSAVLIDEFQDTDPVQYEIFSRLFADNRTILFYIGDPKQAIYGFRGADVFAYMTAVEQPGVKKSTLALNYRSSQGLIIAVNTLFRRAVNPFVIREIEFSPVTYPEHKPLQRLIIDGRETTPMVVMYRSPGSVESRPMNKEASTSLVVTV